ncbi:MAG: DNA mismatch repair protein MutS [Vicinamibacterales bacterium]
MADPRTEYNTRLLSHRTAHADASRADARVAWLRLTTFVAAVAVGVFGWNAAISWWWLVVPGVVFVVLIRWHDRVIERREDTAKLIAFYERGLARLDGHWVGHGTTGERFADPAHLYAADLDLFGRGSLFELLCLARTRAGEDALASWLKAPAPPGVVLDRQIAIDELTPRLDLREQLWTAGAEIATSVHPDTLVQWAEAPSLFPRWLQPLSALLTAAVIASAIAAFSTGRYAALLAVLAASGLVLYRYFDRISSVVHTAGSWSRDLDVLSRILAHLEKQAFDSVLLTELVSTLRRLAPPPSLAIRQLHRLSEMHDWQHNVLFAAVAIPLLWTVHLALAMERWRLRHGTDVRTWLRTVGEIEALSSIAAYRYERPGDVFPDLTDATAASFVGAALGHPLLSPGKMVRNDVRLDSQQQLLVVSGSNMSGKSTLLRTVGINTVLAQMGAPVCATSLRMSPLALGATLRIQDSLQEGRSRFFAEITRLKDIADRAKGTPHLLFLLDELFHGTNSHDRLIGASGVLNALLERGAVGLITTHDMALVAVADHLAPRAANVHFDDQLDGDEIRFDYRMKPGPVTSSNALALMRAVGLDVDRP